MENYQLDDSEDSTMCWSDIAKKKKLNVRIIDNPEIMEELLASCNAQYLNQEKKYPFTVDISHINRNKRIHNIS